MSTLFGM